MSIKREEGCEKASLVSEKALRWKDPYGDLSLALLGNPSSYISFVALAYPDGGS